MQTVHKYTLAPETSYATPYYIAKSTRSGPTFMIVSGIHGNETASIKAAQRLVSMLQRKEWQIRKGTLVVVPLVNQKAYRQRIRGVPDLNRTFPTKSNKSATHGLSAALFTLMRRHRPAWYLDLHEANGLSQQSSTVLGQTLVTHPSGQAVAPSRRIIAAINRTIDKRSHHFNLRLHGLPGSSRTAAARLLGAKSVTVETSWSLPHAVRVRYQLDMVHRFLAEARLL